MYIYKITEVHFSSTPCFKLDHTSHIKALLFYKSMSATGIPAQILAVKKK